jgi:hypothetical protein
MHWITEQLDMDVMRCKRLLRQIAAVLISSQFVGCVPIFESYQRVDVVDARYLHGICASYGPRDLAYFPFHGIFLSLSLSSLQFGLHYSKTTTVELASDEVTVVGSRHGAPASWSAKLVPIMHGGLGTDPPEFAYMIDPITSTTDHRTQKEPDTIWASYSIRDRNLPNRIVAIPRDMEPATIRIPAMTINGTKYEPQELTIVRKKYSGVIPVNC